jgi:hypothetical protein
LLEAYKALIFINKATKQFLFHSRWSNLICEQNASTSLMMSKY